MHRKSGVVGGGREFEQWINRTHRPSFFEGKTNKQEETK
jgi:hypothetical protein